MNRRDAENVDWAIRIFGGAVLVKAEMYNISTV